MSDYIVLGLRWLAAIFKSRAALQTENLALRHQLIFLHRSAKRAKVRRADRILWSVLSRV